MSEISTGNVARYCKPMTLDENKKPTSAAFQKRVQHDEKYLSVYLLEFFQKHTEQENVSETKKYMEEERDFTFKANGSFAVINIEFSKKYIFDIISQQIYYREENLPHCGIFHDAVDLVIAELLAQCVKNTYLVKDINES